MRNMSFMLTKKQILAKTKFVTRRDGWLFAEVGDIYQPVEKGMGLRPGEKIKKLGGPIVVTGFRRESLARLLTGTVLYGPNEMVLEGFPGMSPDEFIRMFCRSHKGCAADKVISRIQFEYV
jgi:hypothetical protein